MGLHKHLPISEDKMNVKSPVNSICEVLRRIYHSTNDEKIKYECRVATSMAKSMSRRISELKGNDSWFRGYWDANPDK